MNDKAAVKKSMAASKRAWLRRQAIHIASQLPENEEEALYVLYCARQLVLSYMREDTVVPEGFADLGPRVVRGGA